MLSDRDVRLIRPSLAFVTSDTEALQLASMAVRQAAVFNPVTVHADVSLVAAAEILLRWEIGALPVVGAGDKLLGIITYTDILREFVATNK
jgi:acetoin utilization protein AcuB